VPLFVGRDRRAERWPTPAAAALESIEGLNRRFVISRKDHRVLRRLQVQPEHIGRLLLEFGSSEAI
jgi:hypothetical protein